MNLKAILKDLGFLDRELSVLLTDDHRISELNSRYLGREGPTNVLAFPMEGGPGPGVKTEMLGDIVVSVETALRESGEQGRSLGETIDRLLVHGLLHLLGYDHEASPIEAEKMEAEEERIIALIGEE